MKEGITRQAEKVEGTRDIKVVKVWSAPYILENTISRYNMLGEAIDSHVLKGFCRCIKKTFQNGTTKSLVPGAAEAMVTFDKLFTASPLTAFKDIWKDRSKQQEWLPTVNWPKIFDEPPWEKVAFVFM